VFTDFQQGASSMIDGLVAGKLVGDAEMREGKNASKFAVAKVKASTGDGDQVLVNVIAFAPEACAALMALQDGDPVALTGSLTPKVWSDKQGNTKPALDMVAANVMTPYQLGKKQAADTNL
jgi:single-stranded DNA-binding protein